MDKNKIQMLPEQQQQISTMLQNQGISQEYVDKIINGSFEEYGNADDLEKSFGGLKKHSDVLQKLSDGYTIDELQGQGISISKIQDFSQMLTEKNLTVDNAKAIYQYSVGSNMILGVKRGKSVDTIQEQIMLDLEETLQGRGVGQDDVEQIKQFVKSADYQKTALHDNYDIINQYMTQKGLPANSFVCARSAMQSMDRCTHIDETIAQLEDGIGKTNLPKSMKLYRAVKSEYLTKGLKDGESLNSLIGKQISNKGQTSTSPLYDSSFASLDDYDTVFEIYAPQGTRGSYIAELSAYDSTEQEVLLNPNDLYITGVQTGVIDKNGKTKNILQALCLSKDRECYKEFAELEQSTEIQNQNQEQSKEQPQNESSQNLPTKQNIFAQFFNKIRAKFIKKQELDSSKAVDKEGQTLDVSKNSTISGKKPWDLEPEKKAEIQQGQVELAKKHREIQEQAPEEKIVQEPDIETDDLGR